MESLKSLVEVVHDSTLPWIDGRVDLPADLTNLFTRQKPINFPFPSKEELKELYDIAQPSTFGKGQEAVLDPTYRSARTLVTKDFAINFRPDQALLRQIQQFMMTAKDAQSQVRAQLYRVNIYGPGDFFKEHQDTPQTGSGHFGSLVFCLPTEFEGGAFVLRNPSGEEVKFDWGKAHHEASLKNATSTESDVVGDSNNKVCSVEYVAFASDLAHWVEPVTAGYRVTVTYHLFLDNISHELEVLTETIPSLMMKRVEGSFLLTKLKALKDSNYLKGKTVLFPVVHQYSEKKSGDVVLKGADAVMFNLLKTQLNVNPQVAFYYDYDCKQDYYYDYEEDEEDEDEDEGDDKDKEEEGTLVCKEEDVYITHKIKTSSNAGFYEGESSLQYLAHKRKVIWASSPILKPTFLSVGGRYGNENRLVRI